MKAILVISHGSRSAKTKEEVAFLVERLKGKFPRALMKYAFLELESPSIPEGIEECVHEGAESILVLLNFLNSGKHVDEDIPAIVRQAQAKHPHVRMTVSEPLGRHEKIIELFADTINKNP